MEWKEAVAIVDVARWRLMQTFPWARRTLRAIQWYPATHGTLSIDQYLRCYVDPAAVELYKDHIQGVVWHEVNHVLRRHFARLNRETGYPDPVKANIAGDLEINGEITNYITLPDGCLLPPADQPLKSAEEYYDRLKNPPRSSRGMLSNPDGSPGTPMPGGGNDPFANPPRCGSAAGGAATDELPPPTAADAQKAGRVLYGQDQDIVDQAEGKGGGYSPNPIPPTLLKEALERLRGGHDWRATLGAEIRNCIEQAMDDAEEYTFRRPSRRQASSKDVIIPSSFRPIPELVVVVDVSSSMDRPKLVASLRELHHILARAAIPSYVAMAWNTNLVSTTRVSGDADIPRVYAHVGGGTDMVEGIKYAMTQGAEIVVALTDCDCHWQGIPHGCPIVVGGIHRNRDPRSETPWLRVVDVETT